jgi:hypothetical protein
MTCPRSFRGRFGGFARSGAVATVRNRSPPTFAPTAYGLKAHPRPPRSRRHRFLWTSIPQSPIAPPCGSATRQSQRFGPNAALIRLPGQRPSVTRVRASRRWPAFAPAATEANTSRWRHSSLGRAGSLWARSCPSPGWRRNACRCSKSGFRSRCCQNMCSPHAKSISEKIGGVRYSNPPPSAPSTRFGSAGPGRRRGNSPNLWQSSEIVSQFRCRVSSTDACWAAKRRGAQSGQGINGCQLRFRGSCTNSALPRRSNEFLLSDQRKEF